MTPTADIREANRERANAVRRDLAAAKTELRSLNAVAGRRRAADIVRDPDNSVGAIKIGHLLGCVRGIHTRSVANERILAHAGVSYDHRLRDLTARQRDALAAAIQLPHADQVRLPAAHDPQLRELGQLRRRQRRAIQILQAAAPSERRLATRALQELTSE